MNTFKTPIMITLWDNIEYATQLLNAISVIKPPKIYLFSDIDDDRSSDRHRKVLAVREMAKNKITWDAEVLCRFNKRNEGPAWGLHNAISWAFQEEDKLIILEHDYIPTQSFFFYCEQLLDKYLYDERIWIISGLNHFEGKYNLNAEDSYFFSKFASIAGFATWKRCWDKVDNQLGLWPQFVQQNFKFDHLLDKKWKVAKKKYDNIYYNKVVKNKLNTWDAQFIFTIWANGGTGIIPSKNLIKMIGLEGYNTNKPSPFHLLNTYEDYSIKKHPDFIQNNYIYDGHYYKSGCFYNNKNILQRILNRIKKIKMFQ